MNNMSNESLKSHIESLTNQIYELSNVPTCSFKSGYSVVQSISKSLVDLRKIYEKELSDRIIKKELNKRY